MKKEAKKVRSLLGSLSWRERSGSQNQLVVVVADADADADAEDVPSSILEILKDNYFVEGGGWGMNTASAAGRAFI